MPRLTIYSFTTPPADEVKPELTIKEENFSLITKAGG